MEALITYCTSILFITNWFISYHEIIIENLTTLLGSMLCSRIHMYMCFEHAFLIVYFIT